jgi:thioredoxin reductase (NADPH)
MEMMVVKATDPVRRKETPDRYGQYPRLSGQQLEAVAAYGERRPTRQGEVVYDQGEEGYEFVVVLDGCVAVVGGYGGEHLVAGVHGPRRFLGELGLLTGQEAVLAAVVLEPGELLVVPLERVRELFSRHPALGDLVLRSYLLRRSLAIEDGASMGIVGSRSATDTGRLRGFAAGNRLRERWIDLEDDRRAAAPLRELGVTPQETMVLLWRGEPGPGDPSNAELARMIALLVPSSGETVCDLVFVGVGAGELVATVHAAGDGLAAVALAAISPELLPDSSFWIEGYPGFPAGISEAELAERAAVLAGTLAAEEVPLAGGPVTGQGGGGVVTLADGSAIAARPVTAGARPSRLAAPRLAEFEGTGIHYAPPLMDARLWAGKPQRSGSRQFGRTSVSDVVLFPARGAVLR